MTARAVEPSFAVALALVAACAWLAVAFGSAPAHSDGDEFVERLVLAVPARMATDGVPGVVVVNLQGGMPVLTGVFGLADPATGRAMTADALFRVESISKPVTAWGVMRLAETGRLDLDAPVTDCLTRWQPPGDTPPITARQLLSHGAGLGLGDFTARYAPDASRPALPEYLAGDFRMVAAPGTHFSYSDTGYTLLELAVEDCTGEDFAEVIAHEVLDTLGMDGASFDWTGAEMPVGHDLRGRAVAPYVYPGRASGGLHAAAADIARFATASMHGSRQSVLSNAGVEALHRPVVAVGGLFGFAADGYGLGHFTETLSDGRRAVWHGGQGFGWMSHLHLVPASGDGIVIIANSQRAWPLFAVILREWSHDLGVDPVGMTRVLWAETAALAAIGILAAISGLSLWTAIRGSARGPAFRIVAGLAGAGLIAWPLWAMAQDYLFFHSILPRLCGWLAVSAGVAGLSLAATALGPERRR